MPTRRTACRSGYPHWSYGKEFIRNEQAYRRGMQGLAYEIVINSDPCIAYLMEENTVTTQALVIAHACYGHNSFFKGNALFRQWTAADAIIDYLVFARRYVMECEERHGSPAVEEILDACHALMAHGVDRYRRPAPLTLKEETARLKEREAHKERQFNDLWRTLPANAPSASDKPQKTFPARAAGEHPVLRREVLAEARDMGARARAHRAQALAVLLPAGADQGHERGLGHVLALHDPQSPARAAARSTTASCSSSSRATRTSSTSRRSTRSTTAASIRTRWASRCSRTSAACARQPTDEDRAWFPEIAGSDWQRTLDFAMRNFKDESFIAQYLSPRLIRELRLFAIADHRTESTLKVDSIHDDAGYRRVRKLLAQQHAHEERVPDVQIVRYDRDGDRSLTLRHTQRRGRQLNEAASEVVVHLRRLWGFPVRLETWEDDAQLDSIEPIAA